MLYIKIGLILFIANMISQLSFSCYKTIRLYYIRGLPSRHFSKTIEYFLQSMQECIRFSIFWPLTVPYGIYRLVNQLKMGMMNDEILDLPTFVCLWDNL